MPETDDIILEEFSSGHYEKGPGYRYFVPAKVNRQWIWKDPVINKLLERAAVKLGELNSYARFVPNIDLFIQLHVTKEAVVSSRIEGTQTNMGEALMPEDAVNPERRHDWREVRNYTKAMNDAIADLKTLPLSSRVLCKSHETLLTNVRGEHKIPGEFRRSQNWIGGAGLDDAAFIPPHHTLVNELMGDLENFLHNEQVDVPELIRIGIAHYQFETIHPFLDGNGRIGRLLITLYLVSEGILEKPLLYLSIFFEKNKKLYYDNLTIVRTQNDMIKWIKYFLQGIEQTATKAIQTLTNILELKSEMEREIQVYFGRRTQSALMLLQALFADPVMTVDQAKNATKLSYAAANNLIKIMQEQGYLREITGLSRNRMFLFEPYIKIFDDVTD